MDGHQDPVTEVMVEFVRCAAAEGAHEYHCLKCKATVYAEVALSTAQMPLCGKCDDIVKGLRTAAQKGFRVGF